MKTIHTLIIPLLPGIIFTATTVAADPMIDSWFTNYSARYARIYTSDVNRTNGVSVTTWSNGTQTQSLPAYSGVQEIDSSSNWIYLRTTGLGVHVMGPWQNGSFPNLPVNTKTFYRIPRTNAVPKTKTLTGGGPIGYFVDGVAMFDSRDAFYWNGTTNVAGTGSWNREAYVNEGATFDPANAHQPQDGTYHYHASPIALRYELGDHVDFNATTKTYSESTNAVTKHSPILGWVRDGFPVYGPYAYSNALDASSPIILMRSGYQLRNGNRGTDNLANTLRTNLPAWTLRLYGANAAGPTNIALYPVDIYMEDNAYLGDLTNSLTGSNYIQGVDFDLDQYNGRFCVTPEFPGGTYAYFVSISSNGTPLFPYNIGRAFYGSPVGDTVTSIAETVVTNFLGGTNTAARMNAPGANNGTVTLTWSAVEGGSYQFESTTNFSAWTILATNISPNQILGGYTNVTALDKNFYRVGRTSVANFDPVSGTSSGGGGSQGISSVLPASGNRGTNSVPNSVTLTITLNSGYSMPPPPSSVQPTSVTLTLSGTTTLTATSSLRNTTTGVVTANFSISSTATPGAYTVNTVFGPNTWSLTSGFTINSN
jgi:YHYH protein